MYEAILEYLACPICQAGLGLAVEDREANEILSGQLACGNGHSFAIRQGVADFGSQEQQKSNTWSAVYAKQDYEELDRRIQEGKTPRQLAQERSAFQDLISRINARKPDCILDVGTGRGMFLLALLEGYTYQPSTIVCLDLSFPVLARDRLKVTQRGSVHRVSYIAADIATMPFRGGSVPLVASYFGLGNMDGDMIPAGISEIHRVLRAGGCLLDSADVYRSGSASMQALEAFWQRQGRQVARNYFDEVDIARIYADSPFGRAQMAVLYEAIAEPNDDRVPVEGDWYARLTVVAETAVSVPAALPPADSPEPPGDC